MSTITKVDITLIDPSPDNARVEGYEEDDSIKTLADSIKSMGQLQPIRVVKNGDRFDIVAGHRRYYAHQWLELDEIEAIIDDPYDADDTRVASMLIENMQRVDIDPVDQHNGIISLITTYGWSKARVAAELGLSKQLVNSRASWVKLPAETIAAIRNGSYHIGQADKLAACTVRVINDVVEEHGHRPMDYQISAVKRLHEQKALNKKVRKVIDEHNTLVIWPDEYADVIKDHSDDDQMTPRMVDLRTAYYALLDQSPVDHIDRDYIAADDVIDEITNDPGALYLVSKGGKTEYWSKLVPGEVKELDRTTASDYDIDVAEWEKKLDYANKVTADNKRLAELELLTVQPAKLLTMCVMNAIDDIVEWQAKEVCDLLDITIRAAGPKVALRDFALENKTTLAKAFAAVQLRCSPRIDVEYTKMDKPERPSRKDYDDDGNRIEANDD